MRVKLILIIVIVVILILIVQPQNLFISTPQHTSLYIKGVNTASLNDTTAYYVEHANITWVRVPAMISTLNAVISVAALHNIKVLAVLDYDTMGNVNFTLSQWNSTVREYAMQYPSVSAWEIWNEPQYYLLGFQNYSVKNYFLMLQSAYEIIKSVDPNALVIAFGGVYLPQLPFVEGVIKLGGLEYCDAVSLHMYPGYYDTLGGQTWEAAYKYTLNQYVEILHGKPIWITETGLMSYPTTNYPENIGNQSQYMLTAIPIFKSFGINVVFWYNLQDGTQLINYPTTGTWGLLATNGTPKLSYYTWKNLTV
jgi:endo-1,4-beta-mannosidase